VTPAPPADTAFLSKFYKKMTPIPGNKFLFSSNSYGALIIAKIKEYKNVVTAKIIRIFNKSLYLRDLRLPNSSSSIY
jgi:hypothetical protein